MGCITAWVVSRTNWLQVTSARRSRHPEDGRPATAGSSPFARAGITVIFDHPHLGGDCCHRMTRRRRCGCSLEAIVGTRTFRPVGNRIGLRWTGFGDAVALRSRHYLRAWYVGEGAALGSLSESTSGNCARPMGDCGAHSEGIFHPYGCKNFARRTIRFRLGHQIGPSSAVRLGWRLCPSEGGIATGPCPPRPPGNMAGRWLSAKHPPP